MKAAGGDGRLGAFSERTERNRGGTACSRFEQTTRQPHDHGAGSRASYDGRGARRPSVRGRRRHGGVGPRTGHGALRDGRSRHACPHAVLPALLSQPPRKFRRRVRQQGVPQQGGRAHRERRGAVPRRVGRRRVGVRAGGGLSRRAHLHARQQQDAAGAARGHKRGRGSHHHRQPHRAWSHLPDCRRTGRSNRLCTCASRRAVEADTHQYIRTGCEDSKFGFTMRDDFAYRCVHDVLAAPNVRLAGPALPHRGRRYSRSIRIPRPSR